MRIILNFFGLLYNNFGKQAGRMYRSGIIVNIRMIDKGFHNLGSRNNHKYHWLLNLQRTCDCNTQVQVKWFESSESQM